MRFKDYIKESIIDIPRSTYARPVFDKADTDNPVLKPSVRKQLLDGIKQFERFGKVVNHTLIGSILTKRYRDDADLDVNILFKIPGSKAQQEKVHEKIREHQWEANGEKVGDSNHIINYFSIIDPAIFSRNRAMADGTFDISDNKFIRKPKGDSFDAEKYVADFQHKVAEIDVIRGELKRDMIDYKELQGLSAKDVDNLSQLVAKKLSEIKDSIKSLIDMGDKVMQDRADAFNTPMSPDDIRKFGVQHKLPKNVIYKMLEKYHYLNFYKHLVEIMKDGKITPDELKSLSKITEARGRHIAFTFGRFNPPTIGHEKLLNKVAAQRADQYIIYLSRSEDSAKNPLAFREKVAVMKRMFPRHAGKIAVSNSNKVFDILIELYKKKFTEITMIVGSDRVREFDTIIKKYNGDKNKHGYYNFDRISVVSAGERDPDAEGAMGMSASKMRAAAKKKDFTSFKKGLPRNFSLKNSETLFKLVRRGMNLAASFDPSLVEDDKKEKDKKKIKANYDGGVVGGQSIAGPLRFKPFITASTKEELDKNTLRDKYVREDVYRVGDIVDDMVSKVTGIIVRRGTNYVTLEDDNMKFHKAWLHNIIETPVYTETMGARSKEIIEGKQMKNDIKKDNISFDKSGPKEAYDMGHDYAKHTSKTTPGQAGYDPNYKGTTYKPSNPADNRINVVKQKVKGLIDKETKVELNDIEEWYNSVDTIDKYKERYGEEWKTKLDEVYNKMVNKVVDTNENLREGRMKDIAIDLKHLDADKFKLKYGKSKAEIQRELGTPEIKSFREFSEQVNEWGVFPSEIKNVKYENEDVRLFEPFETPTGPKDYSVYAMSENKEVVKVNFSKPELKETYMKDNNCDNPGPRYKARYWECYQCKKER
tara:strand:+ start:18123 stop:20747 length:2625 start_codon:yes stop_codon:yes gene_type:complete